MNVAVRDTFEIASLLVGAAILAMLVSHSSGTSQVVGAVTGGFGRLLSIVELQQANLGATFSGNY